MARHFPANDARNGTLQELWADDFLPNHAGSGNLQETANVDFPANYTGNGTLQELLPDVFLQTMQEMALCRKLTHPPKRNMTTTNIHLTVLVQKGNFAEFSIGDCTTNQLRKQEGQGIIGITASLTARVMLDFSSE